MKRRLGFIILICIIAVTLTAQLARADSIVRVGALECDAPRDVKVRNNYAYLAASSSFAIVDVSNPSMPIITAYSNNSSWAHAGGVYVEDTLAFLNMGGGFRFVIANIANPDTIIPVGYCSCIQSNSPPPWGVGIRDTVGFMAGGDEGLWIFNISDITNPTLINKYDTPGHLFDFFIKDTLLYAADSDSLLIFNIADPSNVFIVGALSVSEGVYDVYVDSIYAYLACLSSYGSGNNGKMKIINISNPANPQFLGEGLFNGDGHGIFVSNGYVYVAAEDWWQPPKKRQGKADVEGGVRIFNPEDPYNPTFLCGFNTPGNPQELYVQNDLIFVADYDSLQILRHIQTSVNEKTPQGLYSIRNTLKILPIPFKKTVQLSFMLDKATKLTMDIFDLQGRKVMSLYQGRLQSGKYTFYWDGENNRGQKVQTGIYILEITAAGVTYSRKLIFVK